MSLSLEERKSAWCQPISASAFAGAPSRYDEKYDQLLVETGKVTSVLYSYDIVTSKQAK